MEQPQVPETASENSGEGNVIPLHPPTRKIRRVAPLSNEEILELRELLAYSRRARQEFEQIKAECPMAARTLSTRK